jgi:hypothetical protein
MNPRELEALGWPASQAGDCLSALARKARLTQGPAEVRNPSEIVSGAGVQRWIEYTAKHLDLEAEPIEIAFRDLEQELSASYPALLRVADSFYVAVCRANRRTLWVLTPALAVRRVSIRDVCQAIREPAERGVRPQFERLLCEAQIPHSCRQQAAHLLLREQLADTRFDQGWILHAGSRTGHVRWLQQVNAVPNCLRLFFAHTAQYLLWLTSWIVIGRL